MSREIKFRIYDKKEKCYSDKAFSIDQLGICYVQDEDGYWEEIDEERYIVEQYTGLKDKNGKEIYEGDIVKIDKYGKFQIIWNEWACKFDFDKIGKREREEPLLSQDWEQKAEIIGNIHENKDFKEEM